MCQVCRTAFGPCEVSKTYLRCVHQCPPAARILSSYRKTSRIFVSSGQRIAPFFRCYEMQFPAMLGFRKFTRNTHLKRVHCRIDDDTKILFKRFVYLLQNVEQSLSFFEHSILTIIIIYFRKKQFRLQIYYGIIKHAFNY